LVLGESQTGRQALLKLMGRSMEYISYILIGFLSPSVWYTLAITSRTSDRCSPVLAFVCLSFNCWYLASSQAVLKVTSPHLKYQLLYFSMHFMQIRNYFVLTFLYLIIVSCNCVMCSTNKGRGSNKLQCYLVMDLINPFGSLIRVEQQ
jgi:hypothetical protein